jgi:hypothetical protein
MSPIRILRRNIEKQLATRGVIGAIRFVIATAFSQVKNLTSSRRQTISLQREGDLEFDRRYGLDTISSVEISNLDVESKNWIYSERYQAIHYVDFGRLLEILSLPYEQFIFVDLGAGKGRAVLLASDLPFKKIIGVEFSAELTSVAKDNLCRYPEEAKNCKDIELICMDAAEYNLPEEPLVLYLYNPFRQPVMVQVIDNLTASFRKRPRRIVVLYFNPKLADLWSNVGFLKKVKATQSLYIYDTNGLPVTGQVRVSDR